VIIEKDSVLTVAHLFTKKDFYKRADIQVILST